MDNTIIAVHGFTPSVVVVTTTTTTTKTAGRNRRRVGSGSTTSTTASTSTTTTALSMGVRSRVTDVGRRVRDSLLSRPRTRQDLKIGIAGFYDRSSKLWEDVWGEHMHHGYYVPPNRTDHQQAQIDLIDEVLKWSYGEDDDGSNGEDGNDSNSAAANHPTTPPPPKRVVDVGCGIGGSSRHIARKYGPGCTTTQGLTLSPYQAGRATELAQEQGLGDKCNFQVADALDMPFDDDEFDLVWSLESGEHMPDKRRFVDELWRVCAPSHGRIILVTWCHRDLDVEKGETSLTKKEQRLLAKINRAYYLPEWCSVQDYVDLFQRKGATDVKRDDWSYVIAPFWKAVIRSSFSVRSVVGLLKSGPTTIRGAYAMLLMLRGFNTGLIKFGLITCTKPSTTTTTTTSTPGSDDDNKKE